MIRIAQNSDIAAVRLLMLAMEGMSAFLAESAGVLEKMFAENRGRFGYQNVLVFAQGAEICGAMCLYPARLEATLNLPLIEALKQAHLPSVVEPETDGSADEMYLDSLGVDEKHRRQGIAKALFEAALTLSREQGYKKASLLVERKKPHLSAFYASFGV